MHFFKMLRLQLKASVDWNFRFHIRIRLRILNQRRTSLIMMLRACRESVNLTIQLD